MKLPEKVGNKPAKDDESDYIYDVMKAVDQLIDYLGEREVKNLMDKTLDDDLIERMRPTPLFKAEDMDLRVMNDGVLPYLASRFYRTEAEAEQAREALLKLTT